MAKYVKYIIWRLAGPMILICFSLTGIAWLTQSLRFIDMIVNRGLDLSTFFYFSSLLIPSLLWVIIPVSLFISVMQVYNKLTNESELIVLKAAGIDWFKLILPAILFCMMTTVISYIIALYLLPASYREFKDMQAFIRDNYASLLLQEGVFTSPTEGLTVYIRERGDNGLLHGLLVHDNRTPGKSITMMAERGMLSKSPTGPRFILISGNRQEIDKKTAESSILFFERYSLDLSLIATDKAYNRLREPEERYISELFSPSENENEATINKLRAEGYHRLVWPLYNFLLITLAMLPFISGDFNRRGQIRRIISCITIAIGVILWEFFIINATASDPSFTLGIYISFIAMLGLTFWMMSDNIGYFSEWIRKHVNRFKLPRFAR